MSTKKFKELANKKASNDSIGRDNDIVKIDVALILLKEDVPKNERGLYFDLAGERYTFKIKRSMRVQEFTRKVAAHFSISFRLPTYWLCRKDLDQKYRPSSVWKFKDADIVGDMWEAHQKAHSDSPKLFLEVYVGKENRCEAPLQKTNDTIMLFFKHVQTEKISFVGQAYLLKESTLAEFEKTILRRANVKCDNVCLQFYKELAGHGEEEVDKNSTIKSNNFSDGDTVLIKGEDVSVNALETASSNMSNAVSLGDDDDRAVKFKHPTHLVTPAESMGTSSSEVNHVDGMRDVAVNSDTRNAEVEASGLGIDIAQDNEPKQLDQIADAQDEVDDVATDLAGYVEMFETEVGQSSSGVLKSTNSCDELGLSSRSPSPESILSQIQSMQETLDQVLINQKEIQKQIAVIAAVSMTKEGDSDAYWSCFQEEFAKDSDADAYWSCFQEEFAKQEKSNEDQHQQILNSASNGLKECLASLEKMLLKEMAALMPVVVHDVIPNIEKAISIAISEAFQREVGDKAVSSKLEASVNQLDKAVSSKLEATVSRQIQAQFHTSGKQALKEALRSSMDAFVVPAFETSCKSMFDRVNDTFHKGMVEHATAIQQQVESMHSPLAVTLRDTINSASSLSGTLSSEFADGQRKLMALAAAGPSGVFHEKIEPPVGFTLELFGLAYEHRFEEAFTAALRRSDVHIVSWLCSQVDLQGILTSNPVPLSQGVLLLLLQQLALDIGNGTSKKLCWMRDVVVAIEPTDVTIATYGRPIFEQVWGILNSVPSTSVDELSSIHVVMKVINLALKITSLTVT